MKYLRPISRLVAAALLLLLPLATAAQGREYIRQAIQRNGCRNVAITRTGGDLMLYGRNGTASTGIPESLSRALHELNDEGKLIDDVQLTEDGRWLILYGDNGIRWNDIPYSLERKLREFNDDGQVIYSVTFNDNGDWIVITNEYFSASSVELQNWIKDGADSHGKVWSACITDDALVVVYAGGYKFLGNVPDDLRRALRKTDMNVYRLKIAGTAWFFADSNGRYHYNM